MSNDVSNVSTGKPKVGGAVFRAPLGTTLPTDATTALDQAFVCMGYCSEDGLTNTNSADSDKVKAWGGDTVANIQKSKDDQWKFKMIEVLNVDVLKAVYGSDNVTGTLAAGIVVKANNNEAESASWVFELIMRGGVLKRVVLPEASITDLGDIVYQDGDVAGYDATLTTLADSSGNTHYEYIKAVTTN